MLKSMTGYGLGIFEHSKRKFSVEIKTVNSRYNEIFIKMPKIFNAFENEIKKIISQNILRGKTEVYINYKSFSEDDVNIEVDENILDAYYNKLSFIKDKYSLQEEVPLKLLQGFEGVIKIEKNINDDHLDEYKEGLLGALGIALDNIVEMRRTEGENLRINILEKFDELDTYIKEIEKYVPISVEEYKNKLTEKVTTALNGADFDEARIITEVTIFADKSAIDEEIVRFYSHLSQGREILKEEVPVGRKLDFLVQEMNREVNTIGSKASNINITRDVVEVKSILEKIREQVQNIE